MQLNFQTTTSGLTQGTKVTYSRTGENSARYANEKQIQALSQQNIVNNCFATFDKNYSEIEIKNLIAARLQPSYVLPELHDHKALSAKAEELLAFSLAI